MSLCHWAIWKRLFTRGAESPVNPPAYGIIVLLYNWVIWKRLLFAAG